MDFFLAITFCIGTSVANADTLNDCGWFVTPDHPYETREECEQALDAIFMNVGVMNRIAATVQQHPDYQGEWDISRDCIPETIWPQFYETILLSEDTPV